MSVPFKIKKQYIWTKQVRPACYSMSFVNSSLSDITSAWWNLWCDWAYSFDSNGVKVTASNKHLMIYKTMTLSNYKKFHLESNCYRSTSSWDVSVWFMNADNIYTPTSRRILQSNGSMQYMWNDWRTSWPSWFSAWNYKMIVDINLNTWEWMFQTSWDKVRVMTWTISASNLSTMKTWDRVWIVIDQWTWDAHYIKDCYIQYT